MARALVACDEHYGGAAFAQESHRRRPKGQNLKISLIRTTRRATYACVAHVNDRRVGFYDGAICVNLDNLLNFMIDSALSNL